MTFFSQGGATNLASSTSIDLCCFDTPVATNFDSVHQENTHFLWMNKDLQLPRTPSDDFETHLPKLFRTCQHILLCRVRHCNTHWSPKCKKKQCRCFRKHIGKPSFKACVSCRGSWPTSNVMNNSRMVFTLCSVKTRETYRKPSTYTPTLGASIHLHEVPSPQKSLHHRRGVANIRPFL